MNIQFTDEELYQLFLVVDSRRREMAAADETPWRDAIDALREKLLPAYRARHARKPVETS